MMSFEFRGSELVIFSTSMTSCTIGAFGLKYRFVMLKGVWKCMMSIVVDSKWFVAKVSRLLCMLSFAQHVSKPWI